MRWLPFAVLLLLVPAVQGAWPGFHNDARHTGFQSGTAYQKYEESWWNLKIDPGTQVDASPIVADGFVVIAGWDGVVRVLDATSGTLKWSTTMGKIVGTPVISGGVLYVVDTAGALKSFDLDRGTPLYTAGVGATFASLAFHEGKLFVGNEAGIMHAFYADTLTVLWTFAVNSVSDGTTPGVGVNAPPTCNPPIPAGAIRGAPVIHDGKVIFGSLNTWVYAVAEQGQPGAKTTPQWIFKTNDAIFGSPAVDTNTGRLFIGSFDERVYALPASPGGSGPITTGPSTAPVTCSAFRNTAAWTFNVPSNFGGQSKVESTPAIDGSKVYFGANNGRVYAVQISDGVKAWEYATGAAVSSSPAVANNLVVVGSHNGKLYWLATGNGSLAKEFSLDSAVKASPALDGNKTYIVSSEGSIHMLGPLIPRRADLVVATVTYANDALLFVVNNAGSADAGASVLRVAVDGAFLTDVNVPLILAGQSVTVTHETELEKGQHVVTATADHGVAIPEALETNNVLEQTIDVVPAAASKKDDKGLIPALPVPLLLAALAALAVAVRRR